MAFLLPSQSFHAGEAFPAMTDIECDYKPLVETSVPSDDEIESINASNVDTIQYKDDKRSMKSLESSQTLLVHPDDKMSRNASQKQFHTHHKDNAINTMEFTVGHTVCSRFCQNMDRVDGNGVFSGSMETVRNHRHSRQCSDLRIEPQEATSQPPEPCFSAKPIVTAPYGSLTALGFNNNSFPCQDSRSSHVALFPSLIYNGCNSTSGRPSLDSSAVRQQTADKFQNSARHPPVGHSAIPEALQVQISAMNTDDGQLTVGIAALVGRMFSRLKKTVSSAKRIHALTSQSPQQLCPDHIINLSTTIDEASMTTSPTETGFDGSTNRIRSDLCESRDTVGSSTTAHSTNSKPLPSQTPFKISIKPPSTQSPPSDSTKPDNATLQNGFTVYNVVYGCDVDVFQFVRTYKRVIDVRSIWPPQCITDSNRISAHVYFDKSTKYDQYDMRIVCQGSDGEARLYAGSFNHKGVVSCGKGAVRWQDDATPMGIDAFTTNSGVLLWRPIKTSHAGGEEVVGGKWMEISVMGRAFDLRQTPTSRGSPINPSVFDDPTHQRNSSTTSIGWTGLNVLIDGCIIHTGGVSFLWRQGMMKRTQFPLDIPEPSFTSQEAINMYVQETISAELVCPISLDNISVTHLGTPVQPYLATLNPRGLYKQQEAYRDVVLYADKHREVKMNLLDVLVERPWFFSSCG